MKKLIILTLSQIIVFFCHGQKPQMELIFTAIDNTTYTRLDSVKVMNRTQGTDTLIFYPDTMLVLDYTVGIPNVNWENGFLLYQNYPNPAKDQTTILINVPDDGPVDLIATDIMGRILLKKNMRLERGMHTFKFMPAKGGVIFFIAIWKGFSSSIKILQGDSRTNCATTLKHLCVSATIPQLKTTRDVEKEFTFSIGDTLLYIGYMDTLQSGMLDNPEESSSYCFQFATNIPCPGTPTVEYEGQVYNTIQVFSQCWLKENLNVGTMIAGSEEMTNNSIKEKYCYNNEPDSCVKYGGLYQWDEMMQYSNQQGAQGICPDGWHLPTDEEWKILEGAVDSLYGIGDTEWDTTWIFRGYNAGTNLKTTTGWWWPEPNGNDLFGFSALPAGNRDIDTGFWFIGELKLIYTSTEVNEDQAWYRAIGYQYPGVARNYWGDYKGSGYSVRCVRDE